MYPIEDIRWSCASRDARLPHTSSSTPCLAATDTIDIEVIPGCVMLPSWPMVGFRAERESPLMLRLQTSSTRFAGDEDIWRTMK